jgi:hypothetical protein
MTTQEQAQFEREHNRFFHARTGEQIAFCSDRENANVPNMAIRTKPKSEWKTRTGNITVLHSHTDKLNANIPQVAYHRVVNAITLTPVHIAKSADFHVFMEEPDKITLQAVNSKKLFYGERKHGYASLHNIKAHSEPRFIEPFNVQENRKVRITASGKLKLKRF